MAKFHLVVGVILGLFCASPALAWGNSGHRTVCEIAWLNLTDTSKAEVLRLLEAHPVIPVRAPRNRAFGWACTYPDNVVPGGPGRRGDEHYVNYPRSLNAVEASTGCGAEPRCVVKAISRDYSRLRSQSSSDEEKAEALIYLGHWFGDIHQPLHSSFKDDVGGAEVKARVDCSGKLHWVWDTCILQNRTYPGGGEPSIDRVQAVAAQWNSAVTAQQRAEWRGGSPWRWSRDAYEVSRRPELGYCILGEGGCRYSAERLTWGGGQPRYVDVDADYMNMAMPIIQERITQAGIRLAHWLNRALDPNYRG